MTHFPQPRTSRRAPRIHLGGSVQIDLQLMDGNRSKASLHTISTTGGLMRVPQPLSEGDFIEVAFQTPSGPVQGMAEALSARKSFSTGWQQPFRFVALGDTYHQNLRKAVAIKLDRDVLGLHSRQSVGWAV